MPQQNLNAIWVYLTTTPLLGLTATLIAYGIAYRIYIRFNAKPLLHPVAIAVALLIGLSLSTDTPYSAYFEGAQFTHFLLGPATVALAVPLYQQCAKLMRIRADSIKGFAMGLTAHGIGTARAFQVSEEMGAFSGLAMAQATFTTAFILPWLVGVLGLL